MIILKTNFNKSSGNSKDEIIINNEGSGSKANQQRNSEKSAQTFKVSWQKKNPISQHKEFKHHQR